MEKAKARCVAVVLAGGRSRRMGTKLAKQYLTLGDRPVVCHCLDVFESSELIDEMILVVGKGQIPYCRQHVVDRYGYRKIRKVVEGGTERYHSVWEALQVLEREDRKDSYVFIHDGTRPFIDKRILQRAYDSVCVNRACVVGMPVKDTIKIADEDGFIKMTPNRSSVWQIQTPQVFAADLIIPAYKEVIEREDELLAQGIQLTDDAMVVENVCRYPVQIVEGSYDNIKITTPGDLDFAEITVRKKVGKNVEKLKKGS